MNDYGDLIDSSPNPQSKSDILRYWLMWKFGGLYVDVDTVPLSDNLETNFDKELFCAGVGIGSFFDNYVLWSKKSNNDFWTDTLVRCRTNRGEFYHMAPYHFGLLWNNKAPIPVVDMKKYVYHESRWKPEVKRIKYSDSPKQYVISDSEARKRLEICNSCDYVMSNGNCKKSRCLGKNKSRLASVHCPVNKW